MLWDWNKSQNFVFILYHHTFLACYLETYYTVIIKYLQNYFLHYILIKQHRDIALVLALLVLQIFSDVGFVVWYLSRRLAARPTVSAVHI